MTVGSGRLALFIAILAFSSEGYAQNYFLQARRPTADWYTFIGADWSHETPGGENTNGKLIEVRGIFPTDTEIAISGQHLKIDDESGGSSRDFGETIVSVTQGFRCDRTSWLNYWSLEAGKIIHTAPEELQSNQNSYARVRFVGGWTRLGYDASFTAYDGTEPETGEARRKHTASFGLRSQLSQLHVGLGIHWSEMSFGVAKGTYDFVSMYRFFNGHALYGIAEKGFSGGDTSRYVGIGYEFRF